LWFVYFKQSKRVRATYARASSAPRIRRLSAVAISVAAATLICVAGFSGYQEWSTGDWTHYKSFGGKFSVDAPSTGSEVKSPPTVDAPETITASFVREGFEFAVATFATDWDESDTDALLQNVQSNLLKGTSSTLLSSDFRFLQGRRVLEFVATHGPVAATLRARVFRHQGRVYAVIASGTGDNTERVAARFFESLQVW
jgi:hypothetical protein